MIAYIVDGSLPYVNLKGWLEVADDTPIRQSCEQDAYSTLLAYGEIANLARESDIVKLETKNGIYWGGITEAELTKGDTDTVKITFGMGTDFIDSEVARVVYSSLANNGNVTSTVNVWFENMFKFAYASFPPEVDFANPLRRVSEVPNVMGTFFFQDIQLPFSQAVRQLYKQGIRPIYTLDNDVINLSFESEKLAPISLNLEDVLDYQISLKNDTFNCVLPQINDGNIIYFINKLYLTNDGTVVDGASVLNREQLPFPSKVSVIEFNTRDDGSINYEEINNVLLNNSYNNSAVIKISRDYLFFDLFDPIIFRNLGREVELYLNEFDIKLRSVISEIEIMNGTITMKLGLSQTRLFDRLRRN